MKITTKQTKYFLFRVFYFTNFFLFQVTTEKDKKFNMTTIMPVSLKMVSNCIRDSVDDTLVIDGSKIDHVMLFIFFVINKTLF